MRYSVGAAQTKERLRYIISSYFARAQFEANATDLALADKRLSDNPRPGTPTNWARGWARTTAGRFRDQQPGAANPRLKALKALFALLCEEKWLSLIPRSLRRS